MTQEKFRQWIVILFAIFIVTIWVGFGIKLQRASRYLMPMQRTSARSRIPRRVEKERMPSHRMPSRRTPSPTAKPAAKPVKSTEQAK